MARKDNEMLEKYKARIKRQNEAIKENYDRISATLPRGTIDRIKNLGLTINGAINASLITYLDCMEEENEKRPDGHRTGEENAINSEEKEFQLIDESSDRMVSARVKDERKRSETTGLTPEELNKKFHEIVEKKRAAQGLSEIDKVVPPKKEEEELPKPPVYYDANGEVLNPREYLLDQAGKESEKWRKLAEKNKRPNNAGDQQLPDFMRD